jgi:sialic acid synthase SpsE
MFNLEFNKVFIIAELSANHNGSLETAIQTIKAAKRAGADAIKLQTYTADTITIDCDKDDFIIKGTIWKAENYTTYIRRPIPHGNGMKPYLKWLKKKV